MSNLIDAITNTDTVSFHINEWAELQTVNGFLEQFSLELEVEATSQGDLITDIKDVSFNYNGSEINSSIAIDGDDDLCDTVYARVNKEVIRETTLIGTQYDSNNIILTLHLSNVSAYLGVRKNAIIGQALQLGNNVHIAYE